MRMYSKHSTGKIENCYHPGACFNIDTLFSRYRDSHYDDKMVLRLSYIQNGGSYTGK